MWVSLAEGDVGLWVARRVGFSVAYSGIVKGFLLVGVIFNVSVFWLISRCSTFHELFQNINPRNFPFRVLWLSYRGIRRFSGFRSLLLNPEWS